MAVNKHAFGCKATENTNKLFKIITCMGKCLKGSHNFSS